MIKFDDVINMKTVFIILGMLVGFFGILNEIYNFMQFKDKTLFMWLCIFEMWNLYLFGFFIGG